MMASLRVAIGLLLIGGMAFAFSQYVNASPRFQVKFIRVDGTTDETRRQEVAAASGITSDMSLVGVETEFAAARVRALPYVRTCDIVREYPDIVIIRITERRPQAMVLVNNHAFEVDDDGMVLRELDPLHPYEGPLITNLPNTAALIPGQFVGEPALKTAIEVWKAFQTVPLGQVAHLSELSAPSDTAISMFLEHVPFEIVWGRSDFITQAQRFDTLWRQQNGQLPCKESLDLRFDADLVCR